MVIDFLFRLIRVKSIKTKLLLFSLCSTTIPIAAITGVYYVSAREPLIRHQINELQAVADLKKVHIQTFLDIKKARAVDFCSDGLVRENLLKIISGGSGKEAAIKELKNHLCLAKKPVDSQLIAVAVADVNGLIVASSDDSFAGKVISDDAFKKIINKTYTNVCVAFFSPDTFQDASQIFVYAPIYSTDGALLGAIANIYRNNILDEITANRTGMGATGEIVLGQRKNSDIFLYISPGKLSNTSFNKTVPFDAPIALPMKYALTEKNDTVIAADYKGTEVLAVYQYLPVLELGMVVKIDVSEVFAPIRKLGIIALTVGGACVVIVVATGVLFAFSIARPLQRLTEASMRFGGGDTGYRIAMRRNDELGTLAQGFNDMIDKLARSNQELEHFAYVASHDLQEPLRKIVAFGDRLHASYSGALKEQGADYLQRMQNAAHRMQRLIEDLLTYSRLSTKIRPFEPVNLEAVVKETLVDMEILIQRTKGRVVYESLPTLDADKTQMRQLLQNLIGNALKFHKKEEPPVVAVRGKRLDENYCEITVEDNGIGFDEKYLDRIFVPFERLHGRGEYDGTGIGLAVCQKVAKRHGGQITAKSVVGKGSVFIVQLPYKQRK